MGHGDPGHEFTTALRGANMLAGAALLVALTGPLWVPGVLGSLNFRSAADIAAEANRKDIMRLEQGAAAADQRLKATETTVAGMREALVRLEQQMAQMRTTLAAGAAADLAAALRGGRRFAAELAALRSVTAPPADLAAMLTAVTPFADSGIPTTAAIRQRFLELSAPPAIAADGALSWMRRTMLQDRPAEPAAADPNLLEARALLRDDDLAGALAVVARIDSPRPAWLDAWVSDATARAAADALAPRLERMTTGTAP